MRSSLMIVTVALLCTPVFAAEPAAEAVNTVEPPTLDGQLSEPFWQKPPPLKNFHVWGKRDRGKPVQHTTVRLAYDSTWLYFGFNCDNPLQKIILAPKITDHDGSVHHDESVEIFIDPGSGGKVYYHFVLSCFNVKAEQRFINGQRQRITWNHPWRAATKIRDDGWDAEVAIPLYLIPAYGDLAQVSLNIARNVREPFMDKQNVVTHETQQSSTWRPVMRSFHETESFGALAPIKIAPGTLRTPFLASLEDVGIEPYFTKDGQNFYTVKAAAKGANHQVGELELTVADAPVTGEGTVVTKRFTQNGTKATTFSLPIPAPVPAERKIVVALRNPASGELLQQTTVENPACLKVMDTYLDRNYYTTEVVARAVAEIALPPDSLKGMRVAVGVNRRDMAHSSAAAETVVELPIAELGVGEHTVKIELRRRDGTPFFSQTTELTKRPPKPGCEWKIDQVNRVVLNNGKPFFPFGPVMYGIPPDDEESFKKLADAGFNTFFQWHKYLKPEEAGKYPAMAAKYGLYTVSLLETGWSGVCRTEVPSAEKYLTPAELQRFRRMYQVGSVHLRGFLMKSSASPKHRTKIFGEYYEKNVPRLLKVVGSLKDAKNLAAYNSFDEPCSNYFFNITQFLDDVRRRTHEADGYHPIMLLYSSHIPTGDQYIRCADILCTDPYWVPNHPLQGRNTPNFVSKIVHWNDLRARKFRQAIWIVPVGWIWSGMTRCQRGISGPEQKCQNFLAIIHGAKGLFWFRYPMAEIGWQNLTECAEMLQTIGPMVVQPKVKQTIRHLRGAKLGSDYEPAAFVPEKDQFPDVQGRIFRAPEGGLVLVATNSRYYPVTVTFTIDGLSGQVSRIFGDSTLPVANERFSEELEPFAVRVYRLGKGLREPVSLTVASRLPGKIPPRRVAHRNNCRTGKKNVFPNPSFEQETLPGQADYYFGDGAAIARDQAGEFGEKCIKLLNDRRRGYVQMYWYCTPRHEKPTPYIWSFWAKGAKGGEKLWLRNGPKEATITVTPDWQRYHLATAVPPRAETLSFWIRLSRRGAVWLDGMQLEKGYELTEFEE